MRVMNPLTINGAEKMWIFEHYGANETNIKLYN